MTASLRVGHLSLRVMDGEIQYILRAAITRAESCANFPFWKGESPVTIQPSSWLKNSFLKKETQRRNCWDYCENFVLYGEQNCALFTPEVEIKQS